MTDNFEILIDSEYISSNTKKKKVRTAGRRHDERVLISVDNLRCTAFPYVFPENTDPNEETFEIVKFWPVKNESYTKWDLEIIDQILDDKSKVEFRIGHFDVQKVKNGTK